MRRLLLVLLAVLPACSDDEPSTVEFPANVTDATLTKAAAIDGHDVWVDEAERTVYVEDCDTARTITQEGGPYGPTSGERGHAFICS